MTLCEGFSSGYVNAVSTHMSEIGTELFNQKLFHQGEVSDMAISIENQWTAVRHRQPSKGTT